MNGIFLTYILLHEFYTCSIIGEETYYRKHLEKISSTGVNEASELLKAEEKHLANVAEIETKIDFLNEIGYETVKKVCSLVIREDDFIFPLQNAWNVCSLTGTITNKFLLISGYHGDQFFQYNVDIKFESFFRSLWLYFHVQRLQMLRIKTWYESLNVRSKKLPTASLIKKFLQDTQNDTKIINQHFEDAFVRIHQFLDETKKKAEEQFHANI